jgi:hypothetical protein
LNLRQRVRYSLPQEDAGHALEGDRSMRMLAVATLFVALSLPAVAGPCSAPPPPVNTSSLPAGPSAG